MHGRSRKPKQPPAPPSLLPAYGELRDQLDNGDIILFSGTARFSRAIKRATRSHWSHVAMVARVPGGRPLLWEATLDTDLPDVVTGEMASGVNLYDLEHWILHYGGETAIRRLHVERTSEMSQALYDFYLEARGRPYERNRLELLRAVNDSSLSLERQKSTLESYYCAELVAEAYQRMGLLTKRPPSNEYVPRDFAPERAEGLKLKRKAALGEVVWVCKPT